MHLIAKLASMYKLTYKTGYSLLLNTGSLGSLRTAKRLKLTHFKVSGKMLGKSGLP